MNFIGYEFERENFLEGKIKGFRLVDIRTKEVLVDTKFTGLTTTYEADFLKPICRQMAASLMGISVEEYVEEYKKSPLFDEGTPICLNLDEIEF